MMSLVLNNLDQMNRVLFSVKQNQPLEKGNTEKKKCFSNSQHTAISVKLPLFRKQIPSYIGQPRLVFETDMHFNHEYNLYNKIS